MVIVMVDHEKETKKKYVAMHIVVCTNDFVIDLFKLAGTNNEKSIEVDDATRREVNDERNTKFTKESNSEPVIMKEVSKSTLECKIEIIFENVGVLLMLPLSSSKTLLGKTSILSLAFNTTFEIINIEISRDNKNFPLISHRNSRNMLVKITKHI